MVIGSIKTDSNVFLAPMAGVTDRSFRLICRQMGAGMTYSEMVSAKGILHKNDNTLNMLKIMPEERPCALQIFGREPDVMAEAVSFILDNKGICGGIDAIDINCGCPAPKIVKSGEGSALLREPELIGKIVKAVKGSAKNLPVTIKIRKGYSKSSVNAVLVSKIAEASGAAAICIHGRTRDQMYSGQADWGIIAEIKAGVSIPVIGNGDVTSPDKAKEMIRRTGCDAVMIGRAAWGNPWIFTRTMKYLATGSAPDLPSLGEKVDLALKHTKLIIADKGEFIGIREMRRHLHMYTKGLRGASEARVLINSANSYADIEEIMSKLLIYPGKC